MIRLICLLSLAWASAASAQVVTAQYDNARSGAYNREKALTPRSVKPATFGKIASLKVDGPVYAQILYLPSVKIGGRTHSVIFAATEHNSVYAFDANSPGDPLWHVSLSASVAGATPVPSRDVACPFIRPEVGITSTPVIDTTTGTIYVLARTKEGERYVQRLYALDVVAGALRHSPVEIQASVRGHGAGSTNGIVRFDPLRENPRAALLLVNGRVILSWASSCDVGPFHGWVMAYDARTLAQVAVFNATPDGDEGGIWQGDAGLAADEKGRIYAVTGNGTFDAASGGSDYGDTVLQLSFGPNGFVVSDYFTPFDQKKLEETDGDLGSGAPLLISNLLFVGGKGGRLYLLNRNKLGRFDATGDRSAVQTMPSPGMVMGASAYWNGQVYSLWSDDVIKTFAFQNGRLSATPTSSGWHKFTDPGATPTVSANGSADGIVWVIETRSWNGSERPAVLHAFDASNLSRELYTSEMNAGRDRADLAVRFAIPTVAAGRVYIGTRGAVEVYGLIATR